MSAITRRDALGLIGGGAAAWATTALGIGDGLHAQPAGFPNGAIVRTLLKDVPPSALTGPTLFHEHLSIRYPLTRALAEQQGRPVPASFTDDVDVMVEETKAAGKDSISCIVDGGHPDMDRGSRKRSRYSYRCCRRPASATRPSTVSSWTTRAGLLRSYPAASGPSTLIKRP